MPMASVGLPTVRTLLLGGAAAVLVAAFLVLASVDYLLFHVLVELIAVAVAFAIFILVWSSRPYLENAYFLVLGVGLLFVAGPTLLHVLTFDGMGVLGATTNTAALFWIAGGVLAGATTIAAPLSIGRQVRAGPLLGVYLLATAGCLALIGLGLFPDVVVEGGGTTSVGIAAEGVIVLMIGLGMVLLFRRRAAFDEAILRLLLGAHGAYLAAEVCLALYLVQTGAMDLLGHLLRLLAFYLFAWAIVEFGVRRPYAVLFLDLSARTDELRQAREYADSLLEHAPGPILVLDGDDRVTRLNRAFERLTGRTGTGLAGRRIDEALPELAGTLATVRCTPDGVEQPVRHRDGTERTVLWTAAELRDERGTVTATVIQGQDVTARVEAEARLRAAVDELETSNEDLERYAYVASHDLQEPIRTVVSHVQLLERRYRGRLDDDADEILGYIVEGGLRMQRLIQDLLLLSRVGSRGRSFSLVDGEQVIRDVLRDHRHLIRETGTVVTHGPLPVICGDPAEVPLIFAHLLENGIKFRSNELPRIRISAEREGGRWRFAFTDNGIGIEPEYFDRIFVLFQRLHTRERYQGTGVGLPICKKVVERHGGRIWVTSEPGSGTTFFFTLPGDLARPCRERKSGPES